MLNAFAAISPLFLLIGLGYLAVRTGYLQPAWRAALGGFVLRVALPVLLFRSVMRNPVSETLDGPFLAAFTAGSLAVLALGWLWMRLVRRQSLETAAIAALGMCCSNSSFVGFPVAAQFIGDTAAIALSLAAMVENAIVIPICLALAESASARHVPFHRALGQGLLRLRSNPLIIATVTGLLFNLMQLQLPDMAAKAIDLLANASAPVALIYVGGILVGPPIQSMLRDAAEIGFGKLVLHPLLVAAAVVAFGPEDPVLAGAAVLFAASPMVSIYPILGSQHRREQACAAALLIASVAYFVTINLVLGLLREGWLRA
jgi:malonate transporter